MIIEYCRLDLNVLTQFISNTIHLYFQQQMYHDPLVVYKRICFHYNGIFGLCMFHIIWLNS